MRNEFINNRNRLVRELIEFCFDNQPKNAFSIFMCGGAGKEASKFRFALGKAIEDTKSQTSIFSVYYPETLFSEFFYGRSKRNLLGLEEILADNVSSVVLPLQSPGTFAELGAFVSNERLRPKLIIINDKKYSRSRSFINDGPIAYLDKKNIIFDDMSSDKESIDLLKYKIREKTRQIKQENKTGKSIFDIRFVLCVMIYVFDPISKTELKDYVISSSAFNSEDAACLEPALEILGTNGYIHSTPRLEYCIDPKSFSQFMRKTGYNKEEIILFQKKLDSFRARALSYRLRKNYAG